MKMTAAKHQHHASICPHTRLPATITASAASYARTPSPAYAAPRACRNGIGRRKINGQRHKRVNGKNNQQA